MPRVQGADAAAGDPPATRPRMMMKGRRKVMSKADLEDFADMVSELDITPQPAQSSVPDTQ